MYFPALFIFNSFAHFEIGNLIFLLWSLCPLYIRGMKPLLDRVCKSFLPFGGWFFHSQVVSFDAQFLILTKSNLFIFIWVDYAWVSQFKKPWLSARHACFLLMAL